MPRFFDDYSNTYLTHDSSAGRKQQRRGWKFRENFKLHYEKHLDDWRSGPMGLAAAQQAFIRANPEVPPLTPGWREEDDEVTRAKFYINDETGVAQVMRHDSQASLLHLAHCDSSAETASRRSEGEGGEPVHS